MASAESKNTNDPETEGSTRNRIAARRARIEAQRKAERARERRNRVITVAASTAILAGLVGGGGYLINSANATEHGAAALISGEKTWSNLTRNHVNGKVDYPMTPPVGGDHSPVWQDCNGNVYTHQLQNENAVHSLEHGAVWVTYNGHAAAADVKALAAKVAGTPYSLMSPYNSQSSPITLTAWGHQLNVKTASDQRVDQFFDKYVQGAQTPEPGAPCTGGKAS